MEWITLTNISTSSWLSDPFGSWATYTRKPSPISVQPWTDNSSSWNKKDYTTSKWAFNTYGPQMFQLKTLQHDDPDFWDFLYFRQHQQWNLEINKSLVEALKNLTKPSLRIIMEFFGCVTIFILTTLQPMKVCQLWKGGWSLEFWMGLKLTSVWEFRTWDLMGVI